jgi:subtilisin family serine protease
VHAAGIAKDHRVTVAPPERSAGGLAAKQDINLSQIGPVVAPDPAYDLPGLLWNEARIHMLQAFRVTTGSPAVTVAVADTGLDYTHAELAGHVVHVQNFADPTLCKDVLGLGVSDEDLAADTGGPVDGDFIGHGSWIGGNIAGKLDGAGINGIAPDVGLVSLKISEWCGVANDSEILQAFLWAADHGVDVLSISFGGYLDRSDPDRDLI